MAQMYPMKRTRLLPAGVLLLCVALKASPAFAQNYSNTGPYSTFKCNSKATRLPYNWTVGVTYPTNQSGPYPLIVMFNGMECQADWYTATVEHVASWGYVVVQYTTGVAFPIKEGELQEVQYLTPLLEWLEEDAPTWKPELKGKMDFSRKAVMGHSRGGKLASLHYANRSDLVTAVLLDPVDCSDQAEGPNHPSAIAKLAGFDIACGQPLPSKLDRSKKSAAIMGSGYKRRWSLVPSCTPNGFNASSFSAVYSTDSWYIEIKEAGHMQFASPPWWNPFYSTMNNVACGHGSIKTEAVISEAKTMAVAWFESVFRPSQGTFGASGLAAYKQHLQEQSGRKGGLLTYRLPDTPAVQYVGVHSSAVEAGGSADKSEL